MRQIRIHLSHMPAMLCSIVDDLLARESDFLVVGASARGDDPLVYARRQQAELVIMEDGESGTTSLSAIIAGPRLNILAIAADGSGAASVRIEPARVPFGRGAGTGLAEAIRQVAGARS